MACFPVLCNMFAAPKKPGRGLTIAPAGGLFRTGWFMKGWVAMIRMRWWAFCVLAGCTALESPKTAVSVPMRNPTASVASQSDVTVGRLSGPWRIVQGAGVAPGGMVRVEAERIVLDGVALPLRPLGEGRFRMGGEVVWVHWLDFDNRTAALGNPDGSRVWIMDRIGDPGERLDAAREVLAWYGYDVSRLDGAPQ